MRDRCHQAGVQDALNRFAVTKYAFALPNAAQLKDVGMGIKNFAIGSPLEALRQIRHGELFKPGVGLYHQGLPSTPMSLALNLGIPAAMTALAVKNAPEGSGAEITGDMIGRTTGSLLGGPLGGVVGQAVGGSLLGNVGRAVGRRFSEPASPPNSEVATGQ